MADALDQTFISYHRNVQREWGGFHSLDDHRGAPPSSATADNVLTPPEMLRSLTMRRGITSLSASDAAVITRILRGVVALPVCDAQHARLALTWRQDNPNPNIAALVHVAAMSAGEGEPGVAAGAQEHTSARRIVRRRRAATGSGTSRPSS